MVNDSFDSWDRFLNPDSLKRNLVQCSLFLAGFEILKGSIMDRLRDFYTHEWRRDESTGEVEGIVGPSYAQQVRLLYPKDEFHACCLWFQASDALTAEDLSRIAGVRKHRNYIAHEITKIIGSTGSGVDRQAVDDLIGLVNKIDSWWIREVELPTSPDFDAAKIDAIDWQKTFGGNTLILSLLLSIFDGDDSYLRELHQQFAAASKKPSAT